MSNLPAVVSVQDMQTMATAVAKSGLFGMKTPEQALALMLIAQAENLHPAIAVRDYHIIQGRPALKADAMLARFQSACGSVKWTCLTDERVAAVFSHPQGGSVEIDWDMRRAKNADLGSKDNWKKYPRQMLRARVISEGIRTVFPGCVAGFYTPEEVQDFAPASSAPRDITPESEASAPAPTEPANGNGSHPLNIADVRAAVKAAIVRTSKETVLAILQHNNWKRAEDIPTDKYTDVIRMMAEVM